MAHEANHKTLEFRPPLKRFLHHGFVGSALLLTAALAALVMVNVGFEEQYHRLWETVTGFQLGPIQFEQSLHHWVNDGLMAVFFFLVGLEIKRELIVGELSSPRKAFLPAAAALGGMVFPAAVYSLINAGGDGSHGWGIPMATDIAFAAGCLALMRSRVPPSLMIFLVALAIVDDLGAVAVIAVFYTERIALVPLGFGIVTISLSFLMGRAGVRATWPFVAVGLVTWAAFLSSGVHATVAGVLLALTIPISAAKISAPFRKQMDHLLNLYDDHDQIGHLPRLSPAQQDLIRAINRECHQVEAPLQRIEYNLEPLVVYVVLPAFAFANSGVAIEWTALGELLLQPVTIGVFLGLLIGKQVGVFLASWLAVKSGIAQLPDGIRWIHVHAVGWFAAIGFTMALFINELAFKHSPDPELAAAHMAQGKTGIFLGSLVAAVVGLLIVRSWPMTTPGNGPREG